MGEVPINSETIVTSAALKENEESPAVKPVMLPVNRLHSERSATISGALLENWPGRVRGYIRLLLEKNCPDQ